MIHNKNPENPTEPTRRTSTGLEGPRRFALPVPGRSGRSPSRKCPRHDGATTRTQLHRRGGLRGFRERGRLVFGGGQRHMVTNQVAGVHTGGIYSSSSSSSSSSTVASWYCWNSAMRSLRLDSASVNSISSMPSPVYQWRNAFLLNMAANWLDRRVQSSCMAVVLPVMVVDILRPRGGMSQMEVLQLLGIHSTKKAEFLSIMLAISWSTSLEESLPRKATEHERYLPWRGSHAQSMFLASNDCWTRSEVDRVRYDWVARDCIGYVTGNRGSSLRQVEV